MEGVLRDIPNVLVYINDLLVHTDTHEKHLQVLDQVLARLHKNPQSGSLGLQVGGESGSKRWAVGMKLPKFQKTSFFISTLSEHYL
jgi:hypothetical protein